MRVAKLYVRDASSEFIETYREGDGQNTFRVGDDIGAWATRIIQTFNETLKPNESVRELLAIVVDEIADEKPVLLDHEWSKTNAVTVEERGRMFDRMKCIRCGVTGKRYGLTNTSIRRDSAFRAKKYETRVF